MGPGPLFSFFPVPTVVGSSRGSRAPDTAFLSPLTGGASGSPRGHAEPGLAVRSPRWGFLELHQLRPPRFLLRTGGVSITSAPSSRRTTAPSCPTRGRKTSTRTASGTPVTTMTTMTASRTRRWAAPVPRALLALRSGPSSHSGAAWGRSPPWSAQGLPRTGSTRGGAQRSGAPGPVPTPSPHPTAPEGPRPSLHREHPGRGAALRSTRGCSRSGAPGVGGSAPLGKVTVHRRDSSPQRG